ncbi:MAG: sulfite exporter TauE/SafE family protein [Kofleriaceae bacterium]|nr:sulfite exporter TauE/SafE family protein [Kofleriaceae bacterium]
MMNATSIALAGGAALVAGAVNAIAGGGSLITFPALVAVGLPAVAASATNTIALCPGYLGAAFAQRRDLVGQGKRVATLGAVGTVGGAVGAFLLLRSGEKTFTAIVPFLILIAVLLIGFQARLRAYLLERMKMQHTETLAVLPVGLAAIYGGYFGAGMGVMILAALGVFLSDNIIRINALKQTISLCTNIAAAVILAVWGPIDWVIVLVMAVGALAGGVLGGAMASRIPAKVLRWTIVGLGTALSAVYFAKLLRG